MLLYVNEEELSRLIKWFEKLGSDVEAKDKEMVKKLKNKLDYEIYKKQKENSQ